MNSETNPIGRYDFDQLRTRLGADGKPAAVRTVRRISRHIDRMRVGRGWIYTEIAVQKYEERKTLRAA